MWIYLCVDLCGDDVFNCFCSCGVKGRFLHVQCEHRLLAPKVLPIS